MFFAALLLPIYLWMPSKKEFPEGGIGPYKRKGKGGKISHIFTSSRKGHRFMVKIFCHMSHAHFFVSVST